MLIIMSVQVMSVQLAHGYFVYYCRELNIHYAYRSRV